MSLNVLQSHYSQDFVCLFVCLVLSFLSFFLYWIYVIVICVGGELEGCTGQACSTCKSKLRGTGKGFKPLFFSLPFLAQQKHHHPNLTYQQKLKLLKC